MKIFEVLPDSSKVRSVAVGVAMLMTPNAMGLKELPLKNKVSTEINLTEFEKTMSDLCRAVYFDSNGDLCDDPSVSGPPSSLDESRNEPDLIKFKEAMIEFGKSLKFEQ